MLSLIVATDLNYGIGNDNKLLIHIPNDLKRFKELTSNHKIIMGMNTFNSLPGLLPNRQHLVLTRQKIGIRSPYVEVINDIKSIIDKYEYSGEEVFVIGGESIYSQLMPYCSKFYITQIYESFKSDTKFDWSSLLDKELFNVKSSEEIYHKEIPYKFLEITRK